MYGLYQASSEGKLEVCKSALLPVLKGSWRLLYLTKASFEGKLEAWALRPMPVLKGSWRVANQSFTQ